MALPMQNAVTYHTVIPSSGKEINYRPFLIKDEKELMIAQQSEDIKVMVNSLKNVIKNCVKEEIDVDALATFDIEYLFTQIRAKSVGEQVELMLKCDVDHGDDNEKAVAKVSVDLTSLEVKKPEGHTNKIDLYDDVSVTMKYPSFDVVSKLQNVNQADMNIIFEIMIGCMDTIYNTNEIFHVKEQTKDEMIEFLNNLSSTQFEKIQNFFNTMPSLSKEIKYNCPVCNKEHTKVIEGLQSFF